MPGVRYQRAMAYVGRDLEKIAEQLSLKRVDSAPMSPSMPPLTKESCTAQAPSDGICIAAPVQVYLDLVGLKDAARRRQMSCWRR